MRRMVGSSARLARAGVGAACVLAFIAGCTSTSDTSSKDIPPMSKNRTATAIAAPVRSALLGMMSDGATLYDSSDQHRGTGDGMDPASEGVTTEIWSIPGQYLDVVQDMAQRLPLRHNFTAASHAYPFCHEVVRDTDPIRTEWTWGVSEQDMVAVRIFPNRESSGVSDTGLDVGVGPAGDTQAVGCVGSEPR